MAKCYGPGIAVVVCRLLSRGHRMNYVDGYLKSCVWTHIKVVTRFYQFSLQRPLKI